MNDIQILTITIALVIPLSMLLYSNSRISDVRSSVSEAKDTLRAETQALRAEMVAGFQRLENKIDHLADEVAALKA